VERPPATLTADQVATVVDACSNVRDRFVVEALYATGLFSAVGPCSGGLSLASAQLRS